MTAYQLYPSDEGDGWVNWSALATLIGEVGDIDRVCRKLLRALASAVARSLESDAVPTY